MKNLCLTSRSLAFATASALALGLASGLAVDLGAQEPTLALDLTITVVDEESGRRLWEVRLQAREEYGASLHFSTTDDEGQAVFHDLAPGRYLVTPHRETGEELEVMPRDSRTAYAFSGRTFSLQPFSTSGTLELSPIPEEAQVIAVPPTATLVDQTRSSFLVRVVEERNGGEVPLDKVRIDFRNLDTDGTGWRDTTEDGDADFHVARGSRFLISATKPGFSFSPPSYNVAAARAEIAIGFTATRRTLTLDTLPIHRLETCFTTDGRDNADTDEHIFVQLNGGSHYLFDSPIDDFERNANDVCYDLPFDAITPSLDHAGDLETVTLGMPQDAGSLDGWCAARMRLIVNGTINVPIFNQPSDGCHWFDNGSEAREFAVTFRPQDVTRGMASQERIYLQGEPHSLDRTELARRIEARAGHRVAELASVRWFWERVAVSSEGGGRYRALLLVRRGESPNPLNPFDWGDDATAGPSHVAFSYEVVGADDGTFLVQNRQPPGCGSTGPRTHERPDHGQDQDRRPSVRVDERDRRRHASPHVRPGRVTLARAVTSPEGWQGRWAERKVSKPFSTT